MRYIHRVTCATTLAIFFCLAIYLYASDRIPRDLSGRLSSFRIVDSTLQYGATVASSSWLPFKVGHSSVATSPEEIKAFWSQWSKIILTYRPQADIIHLTYNAAAQFLSSDDTRSREAPYNLVTNSETDINALRDAHAAFVDALQAGDLPNALFSGSGIVTVGGGEYFGPAIIGVHMLRKTGCDLPVEIFVADETEYEPAICDEYLPQYGARCLILSNFLHDEAGSNKTSFDVTHYQLKSLAILFSSFSSVLYLDSDSIPLVNPTTDLFSTKPYTTTGLVIWPDFWIATESPLFYSISMNLTSSSIPPNLPKSSSEAGQLLINKQTHLKSLLLATYYNIYGPDFYYPLLSQGVLGQGDKETFMAAAIVLNETYYRVQTPVTSLSRHDGPQLKGSCMTQYHPVDDLEVHASSMPPKISVRPAFMHANTPKMNAGHLVDEGDLFDSVDTGRRLRLWGSEEEQTKLFGRDLEREVWELLVGTGCELESVMGEWKGRVKVCERLREHWVGVFGGTSRRGM